MIKICLIKDSNILSADTPYDLNIGQYSLLSCIFAALDLTTTDQSAIGGTIINKLKRIKSVHKNEQFSLRGQRDELPHLSINLSPVYTINDSPAQRVILNWAAIYTEQNWRQRAKLQNSARQLFLEKENKVKITRASNAGRGPQFIVDYQIRLPNMQGAVFLRF